MDGRQGKALADTDLTASPVPIEKSADLEMDGIEDFQKSSLPVGGGIEANSIAERLSGTPIFAVWVPGANHKIGRGFRRSRIPTRRAHGTLQPQDESIIVGYYTFAKVSLRTATPYNTNKHRR